MKKRELMDRLAEVEHQRDVLERNLDVVCKQRDTLASRLHAVGLRYQALEHATRTAVVAERAACAAVARAHASGQQVMVVTSISDSDRAVVCEEVAVAIEAREELDGKKNA